MISWPWRPTMAMARSSSSSVRSTMFLPNTMRSSAPVMPTSAIERTAVSRSAENSSVTASGVQALNLGIRCALDPGDEALVLTPAWPNGPSSVMMANAIVRQIPQPLCGERYRIDFDALEAAVTPRTHLLLYTSPSNPLGWVSTEEEQQRLLDFSRRHGLWLLADEVYDRLYYAGARLGDPVPSILRKT